MSNEFDLERAKRGEPIQCRDDGEWVDVHYVGISRSNHVVFEELDGRMWRDNGDQPTLRMKPPERWALVYNTRDDAVRAESGDYVGYKPSLVKLPSETNA